MIIPFSRLQDQVFAFSGISAIYQSPIWERLGVKNAATGRVLNGFLLIHKGQCRYEWDDQVAVLNPGSLIYLPAGCRRTVYVTQRPFSFYRISFTATSLAEKEPILFGNTPMVFTDKASKNLFAQAQAMTEIGLSQAGSLRMSGLMFDFLDTLTRQLMPRHTDRIAPALDYIESHYTESMDVAQLAQLCALSESQLYDTFKKKTGMSPIRYRNHLRIRQAKLLLESGEITNQEIAQLLGFETIHYFSRVFKEHTGISPSQFTPE